MFPGSASDRARRRTILYYFIVILELLLIGIDYWWRRYNDRALVISV